MVYYTDRIDTQFPHKNPASKKGPAQGNKPTTTTTTTTTGSPATSSPSNRGGSGGTTTNQPTGYTPSYQPKYVPPPEPPAPPPAPKVDNHIDLPATLQVTTLNDLIERVLANAHILYPATDRLAITTAVAPSGLVSHALVVAPRREESQSSRYKVVVRGPGVPGEKNDPAKGRREAVAGLLEELEKRVGRELLGGP